MNKLVLASAVVGLLAAGSAGGWFLFAAEAGASPRQALMEQAKAAGGHGIREADIHQVALFSYVDPAPGTYERSSMPVMLTLDVRGRDGLRAFCRAIPRLNEVMLRVFEQPYPRGGKDGLAAFSEPLKAAINKSLAGEPVARVTAGYLWDAGVGGAASFRTDGMCRDVR